MSLTKTDSYVWVLHLRYKNLAAVLPSLQAELAEPLEPILCRDTKKFNCIWKKVWSIWKNFFLIFGRRFFYLLWIYVNFVRTYNSTLLESTSNITWHVHLEEFFFNNWKKIFLSTMNLRKFRTYVRTIVLYLNQLLILPDMYTFLLHYKSKNISIT